jgi:subtilisin family serine protease
VRKAILCGMLLALCVPADSLAARWAVGAPPGRFALVAAQLPDARTLVPGRALLVRGVRPHVRGASYVTRLDGAVRQVAFANTEPYQAKQWYLRQDRAWEFWPQRPSLSAVKVAVIDSGIDLGHPEFAQRVIGGRSFVGDSWRRDTDGHGTFVAGLIAADPFNGIGIAGLGFNVKLLVAKVVEPGGVSLQAEVDGITWAVRQGAQVINLSLGGVRDPRDPRADTFSPLERDAVAYAHSKGVVVVVAVGNGPDSPSIPWNFADWPASLPHAIGVAALREDGSVPAYSNRDPIFVDLAAPGDAVFSTIPRNLVDTTLPACGHEAYSDCGPAEFREAIGTSFAAPQVSAAAALLLGQDPTLKPDQVSWLLERSATDVTAASGCRRCGEGRDALSGWGRLNVAAALALLKRRASVPPADAYESNDDAGVEAHAFGPPRTIAATLDYWDDPTDVYAIKLAKGETLVVRLSSTLPLGKMQLWTPDTTHVGDQRGILGTRAARSAPIGGEQRLAFRAPVAGKYFLQVRVGIPTRDPPVYRLSVAKQRG